MSDFAERVTRKNSNNETDLPLTISSKDGLVDQISYFNKTVASKDMSGYYLLRNGEYAYIVAGETTETSVPGVYAVGDVRTKPLRQVVTAVADGAVAVHMAEEYIAGGI